MQRLLFFLLACLAGTTSFAQGINLVYGVVVRIAYRATDGSIPAEMKITPPAYPFEMRRAAVPDEVEFEFNIQDDGSVADAHIIKVSQLEFRATVLEALGYWRFARKNEGRGESPRPLHVVGKIRFEADEN